MAWISLAIVSIIFYTPVIGIGPRIAEDNISLNLPLPLLSFGVNIPFTGPLKLIVLSLALWLFLWWIMRLIDKYMYIDLMGRLKLRNDLYYASRPVLSNRIAVYLARLSIVLALGKFLLMIVLSYVINVITTGILTTFAPQLAPVISPILNSLLKNIVSIDINLTIFSLSILILIADFAAKRERQERYYRDKRSSQDARRKITHVALPITQNF